MSSCLSKRSWQIVTLLCFCSSVSSFGTIFAHTILMSRSSVKIFLTVSVDVYLLCYAPDSQLTIFTHNLTNFCNVFFSSACCWPSWSLYVSDTFSSLRKTFHPLVNCCFLPSIILINLHSLISFPLFPSLTRNLMFVRCSNSSSDILATAHQNTSRQ